METTKRLSSDIEIWEFQIEKKSKKHLDSCEYFSNLYEKTSRGEKIDFEEYMINMQYYKGSEELLCMEEWGDINCWILFPTISQDFKNTQEYFSITPWNYSSLSLDPITGENNNSILQLYKDKQYFTTTNGEDPYQLYAGILPVKWYIEFIPKKFYTLCLDENDPNCFPNAEEVDLIRFRLVDSQIPWISENSISLGCYDKINDTMWYGEENIFFWKQPQSYRISYHTYSTEQQEWIQQQEKKKEISEFFLILKPNGIVNYPLECENRFFHIAPVEKENPGFS